MKAVDSAKRFVSEWLYGIKKGRVTTTFAIPMLVGALIQIAYGFDADPDTTTDWTQVVTLSLAGLGLSGVGPTPPPPPADPLLAPKKSRK